MHVQSLKITFEVINFNFKNCSVKITCGIANSPFGKTFLTMGEQGILNLLFVKEHENFYIENLRRKWSKANIERNDIEISQIIEKIFCKELDSLNFHAIGTEFQINVWNALLKLPCGKLFSYKEVAESAGYPGSIRAVAVAIGKNPLHFLIPCHRVVRSNGSLGGYAGGIDKKKLLISAETLIKG